MLGQYLITLREGFEAALIISIIIAYLTRVGYRPLVRYVWRGVYLSVALSIAIGLSIWFTYGALPKQTQVLFEGIAALVAVAVLSSVIYWMASKGRRIKAEVERKVESIIQRGVALPLTALSLIVVFREGLETVLFLTPFFLADISQTLVGSALGMITSLILALIIFTIGMKINIRSFFYYTSILLILLAAGLAGYGTHELIEYAEASSIELGWLAETAYTLNIPSDSLLHHKGAIGAVFAVMFGYSVKMEWLRLIVHAAYLLVSLPLILYIYKMH